MTGAATDTAPLVRVQHAGPGDLDGIARLDGLSPATVRRLPSELAAADRCCLVARVEQPAATSGPIVGYAAGILQVDDAHVLDLAVDPAMRRRGIATRLLDGLLAELRRRGAVAATLEVRAGNVGARELYGRHGFVAEGRRPRYYPDGEDALLLWRRDLAAPDPEGC